jgi:Predicted oxidoreductases of the aldo/keto reductase family
MEYRQIGNTGMAASVVGLGAEHLDGKPADVVSTVIHAALDRGINIIDVFMPGKEVRTHIGNALAGRRDKVLLQGMIGSSDVGQQYDITRDLAVCTRYFEDLLRFLKTDYIDFGMMFFMDSHQAIDDMINNGVVDYVGKLKRQGKIRAVGASAHNPETALRLVREDLVEMIMFSINPAFDLMPGNGDIENMMGKSFDEHVTRADPARAELYRVCEQKNVGITVMKAFGAGKLLSPEHTPFAKPLTPAQCIHYALTRPAVASALVGCRTVGELDAAVHYADASAEERDYSTAIASFRRDGKGGFRGDCVYCNHCQPCPSEIDIASVNKYLDIAKLDVSNVPPSVRAHYAALPHHASECVQCGNCESRCPFSVPVIRNMRDAVEIFGE